MTKEKAVALVNSFGLDISKISASLLMRKMKINYDYAKRIVEKLKET